LFSGIGEKGVDHRRGPKATTGIGKEAPTPQAEALLATDEFFTNAIFNAPYLQFD